MDGTGDEFLACSRLAQNQHGGVAGSHSRCLVEGLFEQGRADADDLSKGSLGAKLALQAPSFFVQALLEGFDFHRGPVVLHGYSTLGSNLIQQVQVVRVKSAGAGAAQHQHAECFFGTNQRDAAQRLQTFVQQSARNLNLEALDLFPGENHGKAGLQRTAARTVVGADLHRRKQALAQRKIFGLADQKPAAGVVQLEAGILLAQDAADSRRDAGKNLRHIPIRRQDISHIREYLKPFPFLAQPGVHIVERLFQLLLLGQLDCDNADSGDGAGVILDGKEVLDPVSDLGSRWEQGGNLEVQNRFSGGEHALKLWLYKVCKVTQHLTDGPAEMIRRGNAIHFCKPVVDGKEPKIGVKNAEADGWGVRIRAKELFRIGKGAGENQPNRIAGPREEVLLRDKCGMTCRQWRPDIVTIRWSGVRGDHDSTPSLPPPKGRFAL